MLYEHLVVVPHVMHLRDGAAGEARDRDDAGLRDPHPPANCPFLPLIEGPFADQCTIRESGRPRA